MQRRTESLLSDVYSLMLREVSELGKSESLKSEPLKW